MPPDSASDLESLLETLHGFEDTFAETPKNTIRRLDPSDALAAAFSLLKKGAGAENSLRFDGLLGEGGMGKVRLAEQRSMGRGVAVKGLRELEEVDENQAQALVSEGWVMGALEHPNIPPVYDLMLDAKGSPLVLLKRIEGDEWLRLMFDDAAVLSRFGEPLLTWNLSVLDTICNAIGYAHSKGIVHRDLKPQNVMIGAFGEVYVLDWGIAASLKRDPSGKIPFIGDTTQPAGTPCYMAPELLNEDAAGVDERTDVYLVGAMLYECIAGKPPHIESSMRAMVESITRSEPSFDAQVPTALKAICRKALRSRPEERYQSIEALQLALRDYQQRRASQALTDEAATRLASLRLLAQEPESDQRYTDMSALFSECRFAFRQALAAYPDEEAPARGLDDAAELMVRTAIAEKRLDAATSFAAEMRAPSDALAEELATLASHSKHRNKRLAHLERQQDIEVDKGQRILLVVLFCLVVTLPLLGHLIADTPYYNYAGAISWQTFICIGFILIYPRFALEGTEQNRLTYIAITTGLTAEILATIASLVAGLSLEEALLVDSATWTTCAIMVVLAMGWSYLPLAMGYFSAMLIIARFPGYTYYAIAGANAIVLTWSWLTYAMKINPKPLVHFPDSPQE